MGVKKTMFLIVEELDSSERECETKGCLVEKIQSKPVVIHPFQVETKKNCNGYMMSGRHINEEIESFEIFKTVVERTVDSLGRLHATFISPVE